MRKVFRSSRFTRSYKKFVHRYPFLKTKIDSTIKEMEVDVFAKPLETHKLSGELYGLLACTCGYDCRIVFSIEKEQDNTNEFIVLVDIGTHDEVY